MFIRIIIFQLKFSFHNKTVHVHPEITQLYLEKSISKYLDIKQLMEYDTKRYEKWLEAYYYVLMNQKKFNKI